MSGAKRNGKGQFVKAKRASGGGGASKPHKSKYVKSKGGQLVRVSGPAGIRGMVSVPFLGTIAGISGGYIVGGMAVDGLLDWWKAKQVKAEKIKSTDATWTDNPWVRAGIKIAGGFVVGGLGMLFRFGRFTTPIGGGFIVNGVVSAVRGTLQALSHAATPVRGYTPQLPAPAPAAQVRQVSNVSAVNGSARIVATA